MNSKTHNIHLPDVVGKGYASFWNYEGRYRVVKGSRASKKSKTTALWNITNLMKYPEANLLVVRKVYSTLKDSCYTELQWAIQRLGVERWWDCKLSPLEMTYKPTGQKIYFRGLDDPLKTTSITVSHGSLCWMWIEEAYEILREDDFNLIDESIRGETPKGLFKQITLTFNPWNEKHWLKKRFFDVQSKEILAMTTNYQCNEWLDGADLQLFESMRENNPRRYQVAGLGNWGVVEGLIYENWEERAFNHTSSAFRKAHPNLESAFGLDFGYTNDPSALFCGLVDEQNKEIYIFDEVYEKGLSNEALYAAIATKGYQKERIRADSAEPKSIDRLYTLGMPRIERAIKGPDSVAHGIDILQDYKLIIHPRCVNFLTEIGLYGWDSDRFGQRTNKPMNEFNHLMDAMRYAMEPFGRGDVFSFD